MQTPAKSHPPRPERGHRHAASRIDADHRASRRRTGGLPPGSRRSGSRRCSTCCSTCRCDTRTAPAFTRSGTRGAATPRSSCGRIETCRRAFRAPPIPRGQPSATAPGRWRCGCSTSTRTSAGSSGRDGASPATGRCVRPRPAAMEMVHPEYRLLDDDAEAPTADRLTPVYPAASGLGQALLRRLDRPGTGPARAQSRHRRPAARSSGRAPWPRRPRSRPSDDPPAADGHRAPQAPLHHEHPARRRLAFEELLAHRISRCACCGAGIDRRHSPALDRGDALMRRFDRLAAIRPDREPSAGLAREVRADLARPRPMHRLVQGDVGVRKDGGRGGWPRWCPSPTSARSH